MSVRIYSNNANEYKQSSSSKYGSLDFITELILLQENLKRYLSFGCRIPINNNKDNNNGKASCSTKNTTKRNREAKHWMRREGGKSESNMNTHLR